MFHMKQFGYEMEGNKSTLEYIELLDKWNKKINLISKGEFDDIWERHIFDSLQLLKFVDQKDHILDVGSGAGFPGILLAINGMKNVTLVESDSRKVAFLLQASQLAPCGVSILNKRIEDVELECDILTARAFASINDILRLCFKIKVRKKIVLLKGERVEEEIEEALKNWNFNYKLHPSETHEKSWVVELWRLS
jgi:16S rRNA (guanine527-N7)-methyltransferase